VTPLVHAARILPVVLVIGVSMIAQNTASLNLVAGLIAVLVGSALLCVVIGGFAFLSWLRLTFWFDDEGDFRLASGVLTRRERRLQLSRLQGVDIVEPLLARVFGMAQVRIEVAGAGDSRAEVQFLSLADAQALRNSVLARAAGLAPDTAEAPQRPIVVVPASDLAASLLLRGSTVGLLGITAVVVAATLLTEGAVGLVGLLLGGVPIVMVVTEFGTYYGFTVAQSPDGLRTRSGLLQLQSATIPPGRVQALEFIQPWLWRRKDWVRVAVTVAGVGGSDDDTQGGAFNRVLLPVAPYGIALTVVNEILPGVDAREIPLRPAPPRTSRRAWIQHSRLGVGWDDRVFVTRRGRLVRRLALAPHARTQSVRVTQGPWQRMLGLASMHLDSPAGPVSVVALHRDSAEARSLAEEQNVRAQQALAADRAVRWMRPEAGRP
jgi:putative membrane protein